MQENTILFLNDKRLKRLRFWAIESDYDEGGYNVTWGTVGGDDQEAFHEVPFGKVNRSQEEQIDSEIESKIKKRIEKGYKRSIEEAEASDGRGANELGMPRPMLAAPLKNIKVLPETYYVQPKLDGHRCLYSIPDDLAYSRNGKQIGAIHEILAELADLPFDVVLDGELYIHGVPLQKIGSLVRKRQEETADLEYHVYDCIFQLDDTDRLPVFQERLEMLERIFGMIEGKRVKLVRTIHAQGAPEYWLANFRSEGYEGAMVRTKDGEYQVSKRSKSLIKVKAWEDDEFVVRSISQAHNGSGILTCIMPSGSTFSVTAPGSLTEKRRIFECKDEFIGKKIHVEYANLTKDGIPFHPVAKFWRDKEDE